MKMRIVEADVIELLAALGSIILVDLVLSGDNALVIGAAAAGLPRRQRWAAIVLGGSGAILLRIVFAIIATLLLRLPLLQALGGFLLLLIALRLLMDRGNKQSMQQSSRAQGALENTTHATAKALVKRSFLAALLTILVADVTMSLDNVLAIGALASGNLPLLTVGLLLSIVFMLLGSALLAELIERFPWLLDVAALVLAWTAAKMVLDDRSLDPVLEHLPWAHLAVPVTALAMMIAADLFLRLRDRQLVGR